MLGLGNEAFRLQANHKNLVPQINRKKEEMENAWDHLRDKVCRLYRLTLSISDGGNLSHVYMSFMILCMPYFL